MSIPDILQKVYYSTCPKCSQPIEAHGNEGFHCNTCNTEQIAVPRCAEKLLQRTANKLHKMDPQEMKNLLMKIDKWLRSKKLIVEIRASNIKFKDKKTRYTIQDWIEEAVHPASTSEKKDTGKEVGSTPDKEEGKKLRTMVEETPEPDRSKKENIPCDAIDSRSVKRVKLEFPEKP